MINANPVVLRAVATRAVREARAACRTAEASPTEANLRGAFFACVLARRTLLRASMANPEEEEAMIEESMLFGEIGLGFQRKLARLTTGSSID